MLARILLLLGLSIAPATAAAQGAFSNDPDSAAFATSDITRFWQAFDRYEKDTATNPFGSGYISGGSPGVEDFIRFRIQSQEHLRNVVRKRRSDYLARRATSLQLESELGRCRSAFYALKYLYPQAVFPPVYFVIGAFNSGGTSSERGLIIGAEMQKRPEDVPYIVAHELIHFQQPEDTVQPSLLAQCILEGSADFVGALISGRHINDSVQAYGDAHAKELIAEFKTRMDDTDYTDWLYNTSGNDKRPADLGYWIGYRITESYYRKAPDKRAAIAQILNVRDFKGFLCQSGYFQLY